MEMFSSLFCFDGLQLHFFASLFLALLHKNYSSALKIEPLISNQNRRIACVTHLDISFFFAA